MNKIARPLRFIMAWRNYRVGDVIGAEADNPLQVDRDWLIANGYCEPVVLAKPSVNPETINRPKSQKIPRVR